MQVSCNWFWHRWFFGFNFEVGPYSPYLGVFIGPFAFFIDWEAE